MHLLTTFMPYVTVWVTLTQLVPAAPHPTHPVSVPTAPQVTSVLSAVNSGSTGAALSSNLGSITGAASPATGLTAAANVIPGMTMDPQTLLNEVSQVTEIMQFVASLLQTFLSTGGIAISGIPGIADVGAVAQGQLILALLALSKNLIPLS